VKGVEVVEVVSVRNRRLRLRLCCCALAVVVADVQLPLLGPAIPLHVHCS
jgi:hypothetical protein